MTATTPHPPSDLEKVKLSDILTAYREASGASKLVYMVKLRDYLNRQDREIVEDEIATIWDRQDINVLIGAGAPGRLYYAVIGQRARIEGIL